MDGQMDLWNDLKQRGEHAILDLCLRKQAEWQKLEFKKQSDRDSSILNRDDKRNLGKSLSGFSNANGGILIWGIGTAAGSDNEALADEAKPVTDYERFARNIETLIPQYLSPPNLDIEVLAIPRTVEAETGYVAVRVAASDLRPHMSVAPGHHKYFLRVREATLPMEDFQVRDMLRILTTPHLSMGYIFQAQVITGEVHKMKLALTIANESEVSAHHAYLLLRENSIQRTSREASNKFHRFPHADSSIVGYQAVEHFVLHPGYELPVASFGIEAKFQQSEVYARFDPAAAFTRWDKMPEIRINAAVGCENMRAREVELVVTHSEFEAAVEQIIRTKKPFTGKHRL